MNTTQSCIGCSKAREECRGASELRNNAFICNECICNSAQALINKNALLVNGLPSLAPLEWLTDLPIEKFVGTYAKGLTLDQLPDVTIGQFFQLHQDAACILAEEHAKDRDKSYKASKHDGRPYLDLDYNKMPSVAVVKLDNQAREFCKREAVIPTAVNADEKPQPTMTFSAASEHFFDKSSHHALMTNLSTIFGSHVKCILEVSAKCDILYLLKRNYSNTVPEPVRPPAQEQKPAPPATPPLGAATHAPALDAQTEPQLVKQEEAQPAAATE